MTKTFANIVVLGLLTMIGSWTVFKLVAWIGAAAIIVPLGVALTIGFLQLVLVLAKRQLAFTGWLSPFSVNATVLFVAAFVVLTTALALGGHAFRAAIIHSIDPQGIANMILLGLLSPIPTTIVAVLMAFASRDAGGEDESLASS